MEEDIHSIDDLLSSHGEELSAMDVLMSIKAGDAPRPVIENIFEEQQRKGWNAGKDDLARCDLKHIWKITPRGGVVFISIYKKSIMGKVLTDIKADDNMIPHFGKEMSEAVVKVLGSNLAEGGWALITAPRRRHLERNFATLVCIDMAERLGIKFYEDILHCHSRQRIGAVFTISEIPKERNLIVFDDIVTTGSTLQAIKNAFDNSGEKKNLVFFAGINNKL